MFKVISRLKWEEESLVRLFGFLFFLQSDPQPVVQVSFQSYFFFFRALKKEKKIDSFFFFDFSPSALLSFPSLFHSDLKRGKTTIKTRRFSPKEMEGIWENDGFSSNRRKFYLKEKINKIPRIKSRSLHFLFPGTDSAFSNLLIFYFCFILKIHIFMNFFY